jgi:hypothetical protein
VLAIFADFLYRRSPRVRAYSRAVPHIFWILDCAASCFLFGWRELRIDKVIYSPDAAAQGCTLAAAAAATAAAVAAEDDVGATPSGNLQGAVGSGRRVHEMPVRQLCAS